MGNPQSYSDWTCTLQCPVCAEAEQYPVMTVQVEGLQKSVMKLNMEVERKVWAAVSLQLTVPLTSRYHGTSWHLVQDVWSGTMSCKSSLGPLEVVKAKCIWYWCPFYRFHGLLMRTTLVPRGFPWKYLVSVSQMLISYEHLTNLTNAKLNWTVHCHVNVCIDLEKWCHWSRYNRIHREGVFSLDDDQTPFSSLW